jgi:RecA/RadA recombinase
MKYSTALRRALPGAAAILMLLHGAAGWAQDDSGELAPVAGSRPSVGSLTPSPAGSVPPASTDEQASADSAQGDVAMLMTLIHDSELVELRTTYNGSYGASLFFYPPDMTWYVVLFQDKHFWRVIRSQDEGRSEAIYADFARQTERLADVEIRRTQLEAQKAYIQRVIALSEDRARRLQADLDVAHTQQAQVNDRQRQMQEDAAALRSAKAQAQAQLSDVQRQVQDLQRQTEAGLPGARK